MHFEGTVYHNPYWNAPILPITQGCTHNKCKFCTMYKDLQFHMQPMEYIEEDLQELKSYYSKLTAIQLQGANPLAPNFSKLKPIFELIQKYFQGVLILTQTRVSDLRNKTVDELKQLRELGLEEIALGVESGDEWTLERIDKGYHADEIIPLTSKLDEAGIAYGLTFLNGVAGRSHSKEHALHSAEVFSQLHPRDIGTGGLTLFPDTELAKETKEGVFDPLTEKELMEELYLFLEKLDCDALLTTHHTTSMNLNGPFNAESKPEILKKLRYGIEHADLDGLARIRANKRTL